MSSHPEAAISSQRSAHLSPDGTVAAGPLTVPFSRFGSVEARHTFLTGLQPAPAEIANDLSALRSYYDAFNDRLRDQMLDRFDVQIEESEVGGVRIHRVSPRTADRSAHRVLLNLHGGAFMWGSGSGALVEAIPVAATSGLPVIAVDYRLAPEHTFPAASDDVQSVYEALLRTMPARAIGIYGCSAGAILTAQCIAQFIAHGLPLPGGIAMLGGAGLVPTGDSAYTAQALSGEPAEFGTTDELSVPALLPYFKGVALDDPRVMPGVDAGLLGNFPPSLLIAGSRDFALSSVTTMHRRLLAQRVAAELVVFDGLWHAFHIFPDLPESTEVYGLLGDFFLRTLTNSAGTSR